MQISNVVEFSGEQVVAGVVYNVGAGDEVLLVAGKYEGKVLSGEVTIGMIDFKSGFKISFDNDKVLVAAVDSYVLFNIAPLEHVDLKLAPLPEPPLLDTPLEQLINEVLEKRGFFDDKKMDTEVPVESGNEFEDLYDDSDLQLDISYHPDDIESDPPVGPESENEGSSDAEEAVVEVDTPPPAEQLGEAETDSADSNKGDSPEPPIVEKSP